MALAGHPESNRAQVAGPLRVRLLAEKGRRLHQSVSLYENRSGTAAGRLRAGAEESAATAAAATATAAATAAGVAVYVVRFIVAISTGRSEQRNEQQQQ